MQKAPQKFTYGFRNKNKIALDYTYYETDSFSHLSNNKTRAVHGFCFYNSKLVIVWSDKKGYWTPPGGAVEKGETPEEAIIREIKEESNMRVIKHIPIGYIEVNELDGSIVTHTRSFCIVEPYGPFISDPDGDINKIDLIDPKGYKEYFDWGECGDCIINRALELLEIHNN